MAEGKGRRKSGKERKKGRDGKKDRAEETQRKEVRKRRNEKEEEEAKRSAGFYEFQETSGEMKLRGFEQRPFHTVFTSINKTGAKKSESYLPTHSLQTCPPTTGQCTLLNKHQSVLLGFP